MHHLAHYLARQSGCPEHGAILADLLTALQNAHDNGDTLIQLNDAQRAAEGKRAKNWETKTAIAQKEKRLEQLIQEILKPESQSLFSTMETSTVTLDDALQLLSLPREVGVAPDGEVITAQNGRYGPYLKKGSDSRSLASEAQLLTITLDEALAIYAEPKRRGRSAPQAIRAVASAARRRDEWWAGEDGVRGSRRWRLCRGCCGCMPSECAPSGPRRRGRRRPCGKPLEEAACGDRDDSEYRGFGLGRWSSPVVASPPQHSADRSGVSGKRARNADFACLHPSISGRPSGRHGRGPGHHGSPR